MSDGKDLVSLEISKEMVLPVLEKQIQAAILSNIGDPGELITKVVHIALHQKVSSSGKKSTYDYENKFDYLDILTNNAIQEAAKEALQEWLSKNKKLIKKIVLQELKSPSRHKSIAKSFADAIEKSMNCSWNMSCNIHFKELG